MDVAQQTRNERIGNRIRTARKRQGMSQRRLAELIGERSGIEPETARRSLVNNETGKYAPRLRTLEVIAEITEQPLDFFMGSPEVDAQSEAFPDDEAA
jgi:transcriptional regulator with XRE-family HTH domain